MAEIIKTTFKLRRGSFEQWEKVNPILAEGEPGFAIDKNLLKIGDGKTHWRDLPTLNNAVLLPDGSSLDTDEEGKLILKGFNKAKTNQIPVKSASGELNWLDINTIIGGVVFDGGLIALTSFYIGIRGYDD